MISEDGGRGGATENSDLARMHRELVALIAQLERSIDDAPNAAAIGVISDQIVEVNARATAAGRLLLVAQSEEISRLARRVSAAIPDVQRQIEDLDRFEAVVRSVAGVLDAADGAIRAATLLGQ
ncbi:hypothetical protein [Sphingomonas sp.]|jgi:hypothetical protein|uniref:hypothetical protein n=1 Tax=Sphingomonas sp. TaxID=28214 RepID=UPI00257B5234|nr:hypothetical protein [Sphingomonas sp.]